MWPLSQCRPSKRGIWHINLREVVFSSQISFSQDIRHFSPLKTNSCAQLRTVCLLHFKPQSHLIWLNLLLFQKLGLEKQFFIYSSNSCILMPKSHWIYLLFLLVNYYIVSLFWEGFKTELLILFWTFFKSEIVRALDCISTTITIKTNKFWFYSLVTLVKHRRNTMLQKYKPTNQTVMPLKDLNVLNG